MNQFEALQRVAREHERAWVKFVQRERKLQEVLGPSYVKWQRVYQT